MKKIKAILLCCLFICLLCSNGSAMTMWDYYYGTDGYAVELTQSDLDAIEELWKAIDEKSLGSNIREGTEQRTLEDEYNDYLELQDEVFERYYEDVGTYVWIPGLPDEQSISEYQAFCIAIKALCDQYQQEPDDFLHFYPVFSYEVGKQNIPAWKISFKCYDNDNNNLTYGIQISAYTGNVIGINKRKSVG